MTSVPFSATMSVDAVTFTGRDGKNHIVSRSHPKDREIRDMMAHAHKSMKDGIMDNGFREKLEALVDVGAMIARHSGGKIEVRNNTVYYAGKPVHSTLTKRIIWGITEGYDMQSYVAFLENLMQNPSKRAVDELFDFLEACQIGITTRGTFLAYKRIRHDWTDCYTGKFSNRVGQHLSMPRNEVDEDKSRTCSQGFHFCSISYLPSFGTGGSNDRVVIVEIEPKHVVAIPADYKNAKGRTCQYTVVGEYQGDDLRDILASKPVWTEDDVRRSFRPDEEDPRDWSEGYVPDSCEPDDGDMDDPFIEVEETDVLEQVSQWPSVGTVRSKDNLDSVYIRNFAYNLGRQVLRVTLKSGDAYEYSGVPADVAEGFFKTKHFGTYFNENIHSEYSTRKVS